MQLLLLPIFHLHEILEMMLKRTPTNGLVIPMSPNTVRETHRG